MKIVIKRNNLCRLLCMICLGIVLGEKSVESMSGSRNEEVDYRKTIVKVFSYSNQVVNVNDLIVVPIEFIKIFSIQNGNVIYKQYSSHSSSQTNNTSEIMLIEVKITSPLLYLAYLREKGTHILDKLDSIDGVHFYGYRDVQDKNIEIVLWSAESFKKNTQIDYNQELTQYQLKQQVIDYTVEVMPSKKQRVCPFNCFGRGFCQPNGMCLCQEGYSSQSNCQINSSASEVINFDKVSRIYEQKGIAIEDVEEWKYKKIEIVFDKYIQNQIEQKQELHMKPDSLSFYLNYNTNRKASMHKMILLQNQNTSYTIIQSDQHQTDFNYMSENIHIIKYSHFQLQTLINSTKRISMIIGYKGYTQIEISVSINYSPTHHYLQVFYTGTIIAFTILLLSLFAYIIHKERFQCSQSDFSQHIQFNLDQSKIELISEQFDAQIEQEMPSYYYQTPVNIAELNQTYSECYICLNQYTDLDLCRTTKCGHVFHKDCVDAWLRTNLVCPVDRISLSLKL